MRRSLMAGLLAFMVFALASGPLAADTAKLIGRVEIKNGTTFLLHVGDQTYQLRSGRAGALSTLFKTNNALVSIGGPVTTTRTPNLFTLTVDEYVKGFAIDVPPSSVIIKSTSVVASNLFSVVVADKTVDFTGTKNDDVAALAAVMASLVQAPPPVPVITFVNRTTAELTYKVVLYNTTVANPIAPTVEGILAPNGNAKAELRCKDLTILGPATKYDVTYGYKVSSTKNTMTRTIGLDGCLFAIDWIHLR